MFSKFVTNIFTNMIFNFGFEINFINLVDFLPVKKVCILKITKCKSKLYIRVIEVKEKMEFLVFRI